MFDKLIESQKIKNGSNVGRYLTATAILYSSVLVILIIVTIVGYGPVLAEYDESLTILPLVPTKSVDSIPQMPKQQKAAAATEGGVTFTAPQNAKDVIAIVPPHVGPVTYVRGIDNPRIPGFPDGLVPGVPGGDSNGNNTTPPPPPAPTPEAKQGVTRVSEGVLQGGAIDKVKPLYPDFAKKIRAAGIVQVQVLISEDGRVLQAKALNGHALLQKAAVDAARQWKFSPTTLSKVPVIVQGIISFNFVLN